MQNSNKSLSQPSDSSIFSFLGLGRSCWFCGSFSDNLVTALAICALAHMSVTCSAFGAFRMLYNIAEEVFDSGFAELQKTISDKVMLRFGPREVP